MENNLLPSVEVLNDQKYVLIQINQDSGFSLLHRIRYYCLDLRIAPTIYSWLLLFFGFFAQNMNTSVNDIMITSWLRQSDVVAFLSHRVSAENIKAECSLSQWCVAAPVTFKPTQFSTRAVAIQTSDYGSKLSNGLWEPDCRQIKTRITSRVIIRNGADMSYLLGKITQRTSKKGPAPKNCREAQVPVHFKTEC